MAETWITITPELCKTRFGEREWEAFVEAARAEDDPEEVTDVLVDRAIRAVTGRVRGRVAANPNNRLGPSGTIPPELEDAALTLIFQTICISLPSSHVVIDEPRQRKIDQANDDLEAVARGEFYVSPPDDPAIDPPSDGGAWGGDCYIRF